MAGRMIHEMGQGADKSLKDPIRLECFSDKSDYLSKDVKNLGLFPQPSPPLFRIFKLRKAFIRVFP